MSKYPHVARAIFDVPWLLMPSTMSAIVEVVELRLEGARLSQGEIEERLATAERRAGPRGGGRLAGNVAVIPVYGVLSHRATMMTDYSGGTTVQGLTQAFRQATADPEVAGILLDIDSPGGQVSGIPELADEIRASTKPVVAVSNTLCASAAYYLACGASEIVVTPSSLTGSIGVVMAHEDWSSAEEQAGVKTTLIYAGTNKVETYDTVPLSDDARAYLQSLVDDIYGPFIGAVAKGRGVATSAVTADFGQGRVLTPKNAVAVGMADRVDTFEGALQRLASGKVQSRGARAEGSVMAPIGDAILPVAAGEIEDVEVDTTMADAGIADAVRADLDALALAKARQRLRGA